MATQTAAQKTAEKKTIRQTFTGVVSKNQHNMFHSRNKLDMVQDSFPSGIEFV